MPPLDALHRGLTAFDRPEILEAELSGLLLDCAAWGTSPAGLRFPDPPPPGALAAAGALLAELGALERQRAQVPQNATEDQVRAVEAQRRRLAEQMSGI